MTETIMPKGWHLLAGELGTDIRIDTSIGVTGQTAFEFMSTATTNAVIATDWYPLTDWGGASGDSAFAFPQYYMANAQLRTGSVAANNNIRVRYQSRAGKLITTSGTVFTGPLNSTGTWETVGSTFSISSGNECTRLLIDRPNNINFTAYLDGVYFGAEPPQWGGELSAQSFTVGSWAKLALSQTGEISQAKQNASDQVELYVPGRWIVSCSAVIDTPSAGDMFGIRIAYDFNGAGVLRYAYGPTVSIASGYAGSEPMAVHVCHPIYVDYVRRANPAYFQIEAIQYVGSAASILEGDQNSISAVLAEGE